MFEKLPSCGTVSQGTRLGVLVIVSMISNLHTDVLTYKYVDDATIYDITNDPQSTNVQMAKGSIMKWSHVTCTSMETDK